VGLVLVVSNYKFIFLIKSLGNQALFVIFIINNKMKDNFDLKKYLVENKTTTNSKLLNENDDENIIKTNFRNAALDNEGKEIKIGDIVGLVDADITDGNGKPLPGNEFKVVRVNPKTITIEPTFPSWLRQVRLLSDKVKLLN